MSIQNRKKVTVQYRKLDDPINAFSGTNLQKAISASLANSSPSGTLSEDPVSRTYSENGYGTLVLNDHELKESFFFGELVRFEPGADLPLIRMESGVRVYNLTQQKAPSGHEPIRGVFYFAAIKNHLVFIESDLSAARAERYLTWLLSKATPTIRTDSHVTLVPEISIAGGSLKLREIEEVIVKPRPYSSTGQEEIKYEETVEQRTRGVERTKTFQVLKAAGFDETDLQKIREKRTEIDITLQIKFKGERRRKTSLSADDSTRLLRNIPDDEIVLRGPGGRERNGKIEKLTYPANVETIGSLLLPTDVARALWEGYNSFLTNGYIEE